MRVLLTGAGGFLGSHIARALARECGVTLRLQVRQRAAPVLAPAHPGEEAPEIVAANLLARHALADLVRDVDVIVHAAAGMRGAGPDMVLNTVVATRNLMEAARAAGVRRVVLVSSFAVYKTADLAAGATVDERTPLEATGFEKGDYGYAKLRQERLLADDGTRPQELVVLRPGVIYGPGGPAFSPRVGLHVAGRFFSLGGSSTLPLTYVENCADAIVLAALKASPGSVFNVVDDDLPSARRYLLQYCRDVMPLRRVPVPYPLLMAGSRWLQRYHRRSRGQLPAVFSPYVVRSMFRDFRYSNLALKTLGWSPRVSTADGLSTTFAALRAAQADRRG